MSEKPLSRLRKKGSIHGKNIKTDKVEMRLPKRTRKNANLGREKYEFQKLSTYL